MKPPPDDRRRRLAPALAGVILLAAIAGLAIWFAAEAMPFGRNLLAATPEEIEQLVEAWGVWGAVASILLMVLHSFVPVPAEIIAVVNGMLFGALWGALLTWAGAMLGALSAFAVARWLGRPLLCRLVAEERRVRLESWVRRPGSLLLVRLLPVVSFNLVNIAAGVVGAGWWSFLWTTALGILPLTIATALLGSHIFEIGWPVWAGIALAVLLVWALGRRILGSGKK